MSKLEEMMKKYGMSESTEILCRKLINEGYRIFTLYGTKPTKFTYRKGDE